METTNVVKKSLSIRDANLLYFAAMLLLLTAGRIVQKWDFVCGVLITEFILIALPAVLFAAARRVNLKEALRFNSLSLLDAFLIIMIFFCGYFVSAFLNLVGNTILSLFGQLIIPDIPVAGSFREYLILLGVIAASAGICEELMFRGFIMRAYGSLGMWKGIAVTALLFSAMHLNIQNIPATVFLGILLGFVVCRTDSIFAGMLGHFFSNALSVSLGYLMASLPGYGRITGEMIRAGMSTPSLLASTVMFGMISVFSGALMIFSMQALSERHKAGETVSEAIKMGNIFRSFKISWPIYICTVVFLFVMVLEFVYIRTGVPLKLF